MKYGYFGLIGLMGLVGIASLFLMVACIQGALNGAGIHSFILAVFPLLNSLLAAYGVQSTYTDYKSYKIKL